MSIKESNENPAEYVSHSDNDTTEIEIRENDRWMMILIGMALMYGAMVVASHIGWNIPGITTVKEVPVIKEVIKEVPVEKVIEKPVPVYVDRVIEKPVDRPIDRPVRVPVPVLPQRIWVDAPPNIPGCFPILIHLSYGNGDSRSYGTTLCGRM